MKLMMVVMTRKTVKRTVVKAIMRAPVEVEIMAGMLIALR
jgi:hypothetical protein